MGIQPKERRANVRRGLVMSGVLGGLASAAGAVVGFVTMPSASQLVCLLIGAGSSAMLATRKGQTLTHENEGSQ
jgi:hypothetical protein